MMKRMMLALFFTVIFLIATACGSVNQESEYGMHNDGGGTKFIDTRKPKMETKTQDVNNGDSMNQNPNFPNLTNSKGTTSTSMGIYEDKAREVVKEYTAYQPDEVWINGDQMWVTAHTKQEMTTKETAKEEAKLKKRLQKALPRYNVNVKITER
ncbi:hypothetical protein LCM10_08850 [Rossellomorea aquimaris]|uniref:hypothetical protein n=1 Tax=Rossellomorea aquimaris TaxID=189382 RepID=UPI001CD28247|nr:hypothetical protein [Rossellomorea aquimaris]MCA1055093.1 hypothetical protein [Rossellomorea aquimaris]